MPASICKDPSMNQIARPKKLAVSGAPGERARSRILDTAEDLFAREGPAAVTLRSIAAAAQVNVAAVNYYFGSKENLFEEMFLRRIIPLNEERLTRLADCVLPALRLTDAASASARAIVVQYSLGRVLAMPEVNEKLARYYAQVREEIVAALLRVLPHLAPHEVVWRYYWMGGSLMVALAVPSATPGSPLSAATPPAATGTMADHLIAFLVQGFRASPVPKRQRNPGGKKAAAGGI